MFFPHAPQTLCLRWVPPGLPAPYCLATAQREPLPASAVCSLPACAAAAPVTGSPREALWLEPARPWGISHSCENTVLFLSPGLARFNKFCFSRVGGGQRRVRPRPCAQGAAAPAAAGHLLQGRGFGAGTAAPGTRGPVGGAPRCGERGWRRGWVGSGWGRVYVRAHAAGGVPSPC